MEATLKATFHNHNANNGSGNSNSKYANMRNSLESDNSKVQSNDYSLIKKNLAKANRNQYSNYNSAHSAMTQSQSEMGFFKQSPE